MGLEPTTYALRMSINDCYEIEQVAINDGVMRFDVLPHCVALCGVLLFVDVIMSK